MKINKLLTALIGAAAVLMLSCGDKANEGTGGMDLTVMGYWEGSMAPIPLAGFNGAAIFNRISGTDSTFQLVTLDTSRGTTLPIKDTTLYLAGKWRLNAPKDSILLLPDTCRIIDTTNNVLVPRAVRGQTIPMFIDIVKNEQTGLIEWTVVGTDLVPLAPLLGINLSGIPNSLLQIIIIVLTKMWQ